MAASSNNIISWFNRGVDENRKRMIVWCDTYDFSDYPEFSDLTGQALMDYCSMYDGQNMRRLMEVYDLTADQEAQMAQRRVFNY